MNREKQEYWLSIFTCSGGRGRLAEVLGIPIGEFGHELFFGALSVEEARVLALYFGLGCESAEERETRRMHRIKRRAIRKMKALYENQKDHPGTRFYLLSDERWADILPRQTVGALERVQIHTVEDLADRSSEVSDFTSISRIGKKGAQAISEVLRRCGLSSF